MEGLPSQPERSDLDEIRIPRYGDEIAVLGHEWIILDENARNANVEFKAGESASIKGGGKLRIILVDEEAGRVRVIYTTPPQVRAAGALCPSGATFWLPLSRFKSNLTVVEWALEPPSKSPYVENVRTPEYTLLQLIKLYISQWLRKIGRRSSITSSSTSSRR